eukprot:m.165344 g.165344  ORF g.165344 m.165344 type:complete len:1263 (-) comp31382_c0_seq1:71-3859(-)
MAEARVKVAVRVRPFNQREKDLGSTCVVKMQKNQTNVLGRFTKDGDMKPFTYDASFWSHDKNDAHYVGQEAVFKELGTEVLENAFAGYNACIFAYGQTGSGKTYTMMGYEGDLGLIPRLCQSLFKHAAEKTNETTKYSVEVSYMEIYNEQVRDLLGGKHASSNLKVREHKVFGPYVENLRRLAVTSYQDIDMLMEQGNKLRKTAKTKMNDTSSRSHAVFTLFMTEQWYDKATDTTAEKASRLSLVDLAGSERQSKTGARGEQLKEGANINKSLSTLGLVIKALAEASTGAGKGRGKAFIPYRDSILTWLLKDNLGGNAKTVMVAAISPSSDNLDETISTLRYADSAKKIVNHAMVNEDPNAKMVRELREELEALRNRVGGSTGTPQSSEELEALKAQLMETEKLMKGMTTSWEDKLRESERVFQEHKQLLQAHGASVVDKEGALRLEAKLPHLVSLSTGLDFGINIYTLKEGMTRVGLKDCDDPPQDIYLAGEGIEDEHCIFEHEVRMSVEQKSLQEVVSLHPIGDCYVNTELIDDTVSLVQGDTVQLGETNLFRFNHPTEAMKMRQQGIALPQRPALLAAESLAKNAMEEERLEREQQLESERESMRLEKVRLAAESEENARVMKLEAEAAHQLNLQKQLEADRVANEKDSEAAMLRKRLADMEKMLARQEELRQEEEAMKITMQNKLNEENRKRQVELQKQREAELQLSRAMEEEEARKLEMLKASLAAEQEELREIDRLTQLQREAEMRAHTEAIELERQKLLQQQRDVNEAAKRVQQERELAAERNRESDELKKLQEYEIQRNRAEQEKIRAHQMKMSAIDEAQLQAEKRKAELQRLREAAASNKPGATSMTGMIEPYNFTPTQGSGSSTSLTPPSHTSTSSSPLDRGVRDNNSSTPTDQLTRGLSNISMDVAPRSNSQVSRKESLDLSNPFKEHTSLENERLTKLKEAFAKRQQDQVVVEAGKEDDTDVKIKKFEQAKQAYLQKQKQREETKARASADMGMLGAIANVETFEDAKKEFMRRQAEKEDQAPPKPLTVKEFNPFLQKNEQQPTAEAVSPAAKEIKQEEEEEDYNNVRPDEIVPSMIKVETYMHNLEREKMEDKNRAGNKDFEGDKPEWMMHQWDSLLGQPWFRGFYGREQAQKELIQTKEAGSFIVRVSESKKGHYAISVLQKQKSKKDKFQVDHMLVLPSYAGRDPSAPGGTRYRLGENSRVLFNTVPKLLAYYIAHPYHKNNHHLKGRVNKENNATTTIGRELAEDE